MPPPLLEPGLDENVLREPADPAWREAWTLTEKLLVAMHDETRAKGARFVLAVLSSASAVHPDAGLRRRYAIPYVAQSAQFNLANHNHGNASSIGLFGS